MGIGAALLMFAAATAQTGPQAPPMSSGAKPGAEVQAEVSARILGGAEVRFDPTNQAPHITSLAQPQLRRDGTDQLWVEFS
ncbi:hypothetical protein [Allopontixanthobacter sp.]|uniref:hypothetical protein n=1 Tax=Allopontixanthobacter sp. TaxID=2906452 RepID=UPI002AB956B4|nr:hypothetical protein [Allopontixanthobacter sp.]MDZ4308298.1 hypothetical protein [Allopontixanthobacter sp.]